MLGMMTVTARRDRRRAGRRFLKGQPVRVDVVTLSEEQVNAICDDPVLEVVPEAAADEASADPAPATEKPAKAKGKNKGGKAAKQE